MNANRRKKMQELQAEGMTSKEAYEFTKGVIGMRRPVVELPNPLRELDPDQPETIGKRRAKRVVGQIKRYLRLRRAEEVASIRSATLPGRKLKKEVKDGSETGTELPPVGAGEETAG
jgi:hypothetical protein